MHFRIHSLIPQSILIFLVHGIFIPDKPTPQRHTSQLQHQTKKTSPQNRQIPHKCDLICPGVPPLALPPNFMQNCSSVSTTGAPKPANSTTSKPGTTTKSSEESSEIDDESTEESVQTSTKTVSGKTRQNGRMRHQKNKNIHHSNKLKKKTQLKEHRQNLNKKHFRKGKILLKQNVKKELLKHNKHFKGWSRLDGCFVICADENQPGSYGNNGYQGGTNTDESDSEESDSEEYRPGEDTPIEIIYVEGNHRPVDMHQTNYYALLEPQPDFGYGFDPFFIEGKQKRLNKRKEKRKKEEKSNENKPNPQ